MYDRIPSPVRDQAKCSSRLLDGDLATLPSGWARSRNSSGRIYYIDHNTRTTSFTHPCYRDTSGDALGPLPAGWEKREGRDGRVYFLDHNKHECVWKDPRISRGGKDAGRIEVAESSREKEQ